MAAATVWVTSKHPRSKQTGKFVDVIGRLQAMGAEFDKSSGDWHVPKSKQADLVGLLTELGAAGLPVTPLSANEVSALKAGKGADGPTLQSLMNKGLVDADGNLTDAGKNAQAQVKKPPLAKSQKKRRFAATRAPTSLSRRQAPWRHRLGSRRRLQKARLRPIRRRHRGIRLRRPPHPLRRRIRLRLRLRRQATPRLQAT
jgi:hypothetical protein